MADTDLAEDLKSRVAWLYYMEGMTQDEVAKKVGLTRARVLRILANARALASAPMAGRVCASV